MTFCAGETADPSRCLGVRIQTSRLLLRPYAHEDLMRLVELGNNYAVAKNLSRFPHPYTKKDAEDWFAMQKAPGTKGHNLTLAMTNAGTLIGGIGLGPMDTPDHELGYWLGEPYWGKGFASEAGNALVDYAFTNTGLGLIVAGHFADNHASGRVLTKLGFRYTHEKTRFSRARGAEVRSLEMVLNRETWATVRCKT